MVFPTFSMLTHTKPPQDHIKTLPEPHRNIIRTTLRPPCTLQRFAYEKVVGRFRGESRSDKPARRHSVSDPIRKIGER
jgi:hypothetical protein